MANSRQSSPRRKMTIWRRFAQTFQLPASRDGLHRRGRGLERVAARQADLAEDITESRRALVKHGRDFDAGNRGGVAVIDLDLQLVEREALRQNAADGGERDRSIGRDADLHSLPANDA